MSVAGQKLIEGVREALAVSRGETPAARIHHQGHSYVPEDRWEPIATAPKDRKIIVWLADEGFPVMATWRVLDAGTPDEWEGFWLWEMDYGQDFHDVTHWQPMPSPPSNG